MSLYKSDSDNKTKLFENVIKFGPVLSILGYLSGIVYFALLPHESLIHGTYISENALLPGLVTSDIYSSDSIFNYYHFLKDAYENNGGKGYNAELIHEIFSNKLKIESYTQNFNLSNPFSNSENDGVKSGLNAYAFGRAQRADGTESIVISAPLYLSGKKKKIPNLFGISQLFILADLAKNRPYWAKDLIFVATDMEHVGIQAWINSYFETHSDSIKAENLRARAGSIQAALNLEFSDINTNKLEMKLEGPNGKLPNLDLFNTIIRICKSMQFECSLESEKSANNDFSYYHNRPPVDHVSGLINTVNMMLKQATGVPTSLNGYFLNHRIEALTICGTRTSFSSKRNQQKQNVLKTTRIVESTLRSVNNLLERFHQSFFFYLLPSSHYYISIGMYMPAFGLIFLPVLIKILSLWFEIFSNKSTQSDKNESSLLMLDLLKCVVIKFMISFLFGIVLYLGTPFFLMFGKNFQLSPKDALMNCYLAMMANILMTPFIFRSKFSSAGNKTEAENINKLMILLSLTIFVGTISILNFSLSFFVAIFYSPIALLAIQNVQNKIIKLVKLGMMVAACPIVYFAFIFLLNQYFFENKNYFTNPGLFYASLSEKLYNFVLFSKISQIWTYEMINLFLVPIWSALWITAFN